jgi:hypothetical protein
MYLTFDTEGFFRNKKISCVLQLKGIMPMGVNTEPISERYKNSSGENWAFGSHIP